MMLMQDTALHVPSCRHLCLNYILVSGAFEIKTQMNNVRYKHTFALASPTLHTYLKEYCQEIFFFQIFLYLPVTPGRLKLNSVFLVVSPC